MSALSCHVNHIYFDLDITLCHVSLKSTYVEHNILCIWGKIITHVNLTHLDYVKKLPWGPNTCTLSWTFLKPLNATIEQNCWILFKKREILAIHLTNYINFNGS